VRTDLFVPHCVQLNFPVDVAMSLLDLLPLMAIAATASCGVVYGLAMAQSRIRSLYQERNRALLQVDAQAATIDRLLRRQQQRCAAEDLSGRAAN
jgi:hypothetical protein